MRDFYDVLGVGREADAQAIKKAYRKLAHRYHPDKNPGDKAAEERFREATRAYDVLSDATKRKRYDRLGVAGIEADAAAAGGAPPPPAGFSHNVSEVFSDIIGDFFGRRGGAGAGAAQRRGADRQASIRIEFAVAVDGGEQLLQVPRQVACRSCRGVGTAGGRPAASCGTCSGRGQVQVQQGMFSVPQPCGACQGRGRVVVDPCTTCRGRGQVQEATNLRVRIPAGCQDGAALLLTGKGDAGVAGGPDGDLRLSVAVTPHPILGRAGKDLTCEAWLTPAEAALGTQVLVPTLAAPVRVKVPPAAQSGGVLRLRGKGARTPGRQSDLLVTLRVETPAALTDDEQKLWQQLADQQSSATSYPQRQAWRRKVGCS